MSTLLCTLENTPVWQDQDGRVHFGPCDADVDADGANGQHGERAAYRADDRGSEALANGGMHANADGTVGFSASWGKDIVILGRNGLAHIFPDGVIASKTALVLDENSLPNSYVDAETVPYIVVSPTIRQKARGVVLGCRARLSYRDKSVECVVADIGPRSKVGEASIAACRAVGIPSSPRSGGADSGVMYELWPGEPVTIDGITYPLVRA